MAIQAPGSEGGFIAAHPVASFALVALAALALGALPVAIVRRLVVTPHPSDERARVHPRRWIRVLVYGLLPAAVLVFYVVVSLLLLRLADEISLLSVAVAAAFGLAMSAPFLGVAWAPRSLFDAGVRATDSGLFFMGSLVRWEDVSGMALTRSALELRTPDTPIIKRRTISRLGWELDEDSVTALEALWRAKAGEADR
jgi:hypothetical protein